MAAGLPVAAVDATGTRDEVEHGKEGRHFFDLLQNLYSNPTFETLLQAFLNRFYTLMS